jgi:acetyl esterase/lipase
LRSAGVAARLHRYDGTLHGFFSTPAASASGMAALSEAAAFLRDALREAYP